MARLNMTILSMLSGGIATAPNMEPSAGIQPKAVHIHYLYSTEPLTPSVGSYLLNRFMDVGFGPCPKIHVTRR